MDLTAPQSAPQSRARAYPAGRLLITIAAAVLLLVGCAAPGEMAGREPFRISEVTVRLAPGLAATPAFPDRLRSAILEAAASWNETGAAKRVVLSVARYHIYRPGRVLVHGHGSLANGTALVIDRETGREEAVVEVAGMVRHRIGATGRAWSVNQAVEESGIADALAEALMLKLRGAKAIEIRAQGPPAERRRAHDPVDGPPAGANRSTARALWDHGGEMACLTALGAALSSAGTGAALPLYCRALGYRLPGE